ETIAAPVFDGSTPLDGGLADRVLEGLDLIAMLLERAPDYEAPEVARYVGDEQPAPAAAAPATRSDSRPGLSADSVRVTTEKLEEIREIVGDLFLLHSRSRGFIAELRKARQIALEAQSNAKATSEEKTYAQLGQILGGIEAVLRDHGRQVGRTATMLETISRDMRMVPIRVLFDDYPRAVRSLSRELAKEVRLEIVGESIHVDRAVLDAIAEPLIHIVRNAIDHGIEDPDDRALAGKPREGLIRIHANLVGSTLRIEISDDGKGIDVESVRRRIVELGLVGAEPARQLSHDELVSYVFHQGLSTLRTATEVSGRGIGLDVVLKNIEAMGGAVTVSSVLTKGTSLRLQVPISVAVTALLTFRVGSGRYALPATSVTSLIESSKAPVVESASGH